MRAAREKSWNSVAILLDLTNCWKYLHISDISMPTSVYSISISMANPTLKILRQPSIRNISKIGWVSAKGRKQAKRVMNHLFVKKSVVI